MNHYKFNKKIFQKPFRYYLRKLFTSWYFWAFIAVSLFFSLGPLLFGNNDAFWGTGGGKAELFGKEIFQAKSESNILELAKTCWIFSVLRLILGIIPFLFIFLSLTITSYLVNNKKADDQNILTLATPIRREEVFWAKLVAFWLTLFTANLLAVSLPTLLSGSIAGAFSLLSGLVFLFINALIVPLIIFLVIASMYFYHWIILVTISGLIALSLKILANNKDGQKLLESVAELGREPLLMLILAIPVGMLFYSLYWKKFQKKDF